MRDVPVGPPRVNPWDRSGPEVWEMLVLKRMLFGEMPAWAEILFPSPARRSSTFTAPSWASAARSCFTVRLSTGLSATQRGAEPTVHPRKMPRDVVAHPSAARVTSGWSPAGPRACPPGQRGRTGCAALSGIFTRSDPASQSHSAFNSLSTPNLLLCI